MGSYKNCMCVFVCVCVWGGASEGNTSLTVKKVKCTPVQALRLCTGRTARRGRRSITLTFLDYGARRG